jgi:hypothetical protein
LLIEIWLETEIHLISLLPSWEEKFCHVALVDTQQAWMQNFVMLHWMIQNGDTIWGYATSLDPALYVNASQPGSIFDM